MVQSGDQSYCPDHKCGYLPSGAPCFRPRMNPGHYCSHHFID
jgi:hypothetical protein